MMCNQSNRGFSLVEFSIVLVIIGILAGSIIFGRDLLESSRVRASIKDREVFLSGINIFKERYACIPGDCPNLTDYWRDASLDTTDTFCRAPWWGSGAPLPPNSVCNGNGDGRIEWGFPMFGNAEVHGFWQQLALAGLVKTNYTGSRIRVNPGTGADNWPFSVRGGVNAPESPMGDNVCWSVLSTSNDPLENPRQDTFEPDSVENIFTLGSSVNLPTGFLDYCYNPGFTSAMAFFFDSKVDDGKPGTGRVQGWLDVPGNLAIRTPDCLVLNTADPVAEPGLAEYNLKKDGPICSLIFRDDI